MTVGLDTEDRVPVGERAPQCTLLAAQPPAGLIHVDRRRVAHPVKQVRARLSQRVGGALQDRVDRAGADPAAEELLA